MPPYLDAAAGSRWVLAVVFVVAGLDALVPFMPSESTVVACGVAAASTGRPSLFLLILAAASGAYAGDLLSFQIGRHSSRVRWFSSRVRRLSSRVRWSSCEVHRRSWVRWFSSRVGRFSFRGGRGTGVVCTRLSHQRARAFHEWLRSLLHSRGGLVIVFARYLPGGRSTAALGAAVVGYPSRRFHWYTAGGVLLWATQAALLGYLGGAVFSSRPMLGLLCAWGIALAVTGLAIAVRQLRTRPPSTRNAGVSLDVRSRRVRRYPARLFRWDW